VHNKKLCELKIIQSYIHLNQTGEIFILNQYLGCIFSKKKKYVFIPQNYFINIEKFTFLK